MREGIEERAEIRHTLRRQAEMRLEANDVTQQIQFVALGTVLLAGLKTWRTLKLKTSCSQSRETETQCPSYMLVVS